MTFNKKSTTVVRAKKSDGEFIVLDGVTSADGMQRFTTEEAN